MKRILLLFLFTLFELFCMGQNLGSPKDQLSQHQSKALIDSSAYDSWPIVELVNLSSDGKYISYFTGNQRIGCHTLILQTINGKWKKEFHDIQSVIFAPDSRNAILSKTGRLYIVKLGVGVVDSISGVVSFKLPMKGDEKWIAYRQQTTDGKLVLRNLEGNKSSVFLAVKNYYFNGNGLILIREEKVGSNNEQHLDWVDISNNKVSNLWNGNGLQNLVFSSDGKKMAFMARRPSDSINRTGIWYCEIGAKDTYCILSDLRGINDTTLELNSIRYFSLDNSRLFVTLRKKDRPRKSTDVDASLPEVWSFNDRVLQSQQQKEPSQENKNYSTAVVNILSGNIFRVEEENEFSSISHHPPLTDSMVVFHREINGGGCDGGWNSSCSITSCLVSTKTGERTSLNEISDDFYPSMSKFEKYFIYSDRGNKNFFTYEIASGIVRNITKGINTTWERKFTSPIACWINNDSALIMYDRNDIWLVDPKGGFSPMNLTNGYGRKNNIQFFLTINDDVSTSFTVRGKIFLTAFSSDTKENGFYSITFGQAHDPVLLTMGSVLYDIPGNGATPDGVKFTPVKAKNASSYIVRRMSATEYPNLFYTTNFRAFIPITDFHPQRKYKWYSTELHKWKSFDGTVLQGILYKPEDFDSTRKYPVIFNYYEAKSDGLNAFLLPTALDNGCVINIPYYVSNGYLVFCPDIEYRIGDPMQGTYDAVVSAAEYLIKLPFVNARKMGVQGCSWGAIQTNYLVTKTNLFAAACSASGMADWISGFNSLFSNGSSLQGMYEVGQFRIGGNLWDSLHSYIKSSPILRVDKITTPVLLMHTKDDGVCPFANAIEFFTALRRLGKKSWMLVYEGNHGIWGKESEDFSIRMTQFFDHYLKDSPAPFWMTKGVPAKSKGIDSGLSLDYTTKTPTSQLVNDTSNSTTKIKSQ